MRLVDADSGEVLCEQVEVAATAWRRFIGLMGRPSLAAGHGLWIEPCSSIHMFFMRFAIDAVFVDREGTVRRVVSRLAPWRVSPIVFGARAVIELPPGSVPSTMVGRRLVLAA